MQLRHLARRSPASGVPAATRSAYSTADKAAGPDPKRILNSIGEVVYDWDIGSDRLTWGPNVAHVLGFASPEELATGRGYGNLLSASNTESRYDAIVKSQGIDQGCGVPYHACYALMARRPDGRTSSHGSRIAADGLPTRSGKPGRAHGLIRVVTAQHEAAEKLQKRPRLDPATGALNRASLGEHINELLEGARRRSTETFVVLLAAIENLFTLNRTYGYDAADQIVEMVSRLRREMRGSDVIARYAGNKFGLVLAGCDAEQMQVAARRFIEAIAAAPFETDAGPVYASLRIGGVIAPRHGRSAQILFQHAEEAVDLARQAGAAPLRGVRAFAQRIRCEVAGAPHG